SFSRVTFVSDENDASCFASALLIASNPRITIARISQGFISCSFSFALFSGRSRRGRRRPHVFQSPQMFALRRGQALTLFLILILGKLADYKNHMLRRLIRRDAAFAPRGAPQSAA